MPDGKSETALDGFLIEFHRDWVKAGQPGPTLTISMVTEIERLREIEAAARTYYRRYCQDEAVDRQICVSDMQHEDAQKLRDALGEPE